MNPGRWIIPARAGFTGHQKPEVSDMGDHPRTRGVYVKTFIDATRTAGSSPHARGLPPPGRTQLSQRGIIPARAGFTSTRATGSRPSRDHPRTRGVYRLEPAGEGRLPGSSPHARGLLVKEDCAHQRCRIIPARAGFTPPKYRNGYTSEDHPRTRGVYRRLTWRRPSGRDHPRTRGVYR